jgi:hypothetical protein
MSALRKILAGGVVAVALVSAAPAAAQYYPGYGSPYGYGNGGSVGQVIDQTLGGAYGGYGYGNYGINSQAAVGQCVAAVQARLNGGYGGGYGGYSPYGYNNGGYGGTSPYGYNNGGYGRGRVLGISGVEPRSGGGLTIRGAANSGRYANGYGTQVPVDLTFRCNADFRGIITSVQVRPAQPNYGANTAPYNGYNTGTAPYGNDYSQYGYSRY